MVYDTIEDDPETQIVMVSIPAEIGIQMVEAQPEPNDPKPRAAA